MSSVKDKNSWQELGTLWSHVTECHLDYRTWILTQFALLTAHISAKVETEIIQTLASTGDFRVKQLTQS